jgi:hypothetical protein
MLHGFMSNQWDIIVRSFLSDKQREVGGYTCGCDYL